MRKGKIPLNDVSGGELTSAPLISSPRKYSRLLQNFYINSEGHICKVPGYSAITNQIADCKLTTGIDFKKADGTSIKIVGGLSGSSGALYRINSGVLTSIKSDFTSTNPLYLSQIGDLVVASNGSDLPVSYDGTTLGNLSMPFDVRALAFVGSGLNDMSVNVTASVATTYDVEIDGIASSTITPSYTGTGIDDMTVPSPNYTGGAAATFDVAVDSDGSGDTIKYNLNGGAYAEGNALSLGTTEEYINYRTDSVSAIWPTVPVYGDWKTEQALTTEATGCSMVSTYGAIAIKAASTTGNNVTDYYEIELHNNALAVGLRYRKNGGDTVYINGGNACTAGVYYAMDGNYEVKFSSATTGAACHFKFQVSNRATDITTGYLKAAATTAHLNTDVYDIQILANTPTGATSGFTYRWRKNSGSWTTKGILTANATLYDTIDANYSIKFKDIYGNTLNDIYSFQVDGATTPDTFKWRKNAEDYTTETPIVAGAMELKEGISVEFTHFTGHKATATQDAWAFSTNGDTVKYRVGSAAYTENVPITGAFQDIVSGVQFKFSSINGHTLGDAWTIPVDQSVRFGKSFVFKNRLWLIGNDKQTVYYSALLLPTDFSGTGSGYIDFRYVIPVSDELVDISSIMNFIVFFFKNHIVVYSGTDPTAEGDFTIYQTLNDIGLPAANTVVSVGSDIYFLTNKGVKGLKQVLSAGALNVDNISEAIDADIIAAIEANTDSVYASAHYAILGLIMFLVGTTIFVYNYRQRAWSRIVIPATDDVSKILSMWQTTDGRLYMGGHDYLFEFDPDTATYNFAGVAPSYRWTSGMLPVTTADSMYFNELVLWLASTKAATLTLKARAIGLNTGIEDQATFNQQTVAVPAITTNDAVFNFVTLPMDGAGKYIQVDFTESPTYAANDDLEITGLEVSGELGVL